VSARAGLAVGFAGLGRMGTPMSRRVLGAGFPLTVWNRSPERLEPLTSAGAAGAETPKALAEASEIVITMLSDGDALRAVLRGDEGVIAGLRPDSIVIDTSTIGSAAAVELAAEVSERGAHWIDSPVSGSTALAEKGELTLMLGGAADAIERAGPVLDVLSRQRFHLGGAGAGAAMKVAVQAVLAVLNEGLAEGLVLAERAGIPREAAYEVFSGGVVAAPYVLYKRDAFVRPDETAVAFTADLMRKDLRLVSELAEDVGVELAAVRAADGVLGRAGDLGLGAGDFSGVAQVIREDGARRDGDS
jgi:3-hydroxyisobutyrate dehydrogenase-like beta-hydroxyacid dehydrogenase